MVMRMSDVPANPLWEIRIILTKTTIAGTGHNWKSHPEASRGPLSESPLGAPIFWGCAFFLDRAGACAPLGANVC